MPPTFTVPDIFGISPSIAYVKHSIVNKIVDNARMRKVRSEREGEGRRGREGSEQGMILHLGE